MARKPAKKQPENKASAGAPENKGANQKEDMRKEMQDRLSEMSDDDLREQLEAGREAIAMLEAEASRRSIDPKPNDDALNADDAAAIDHSDAKPYVFLKDGTVITRSGAKVEGRKGQQAAFTEEEAEGAEEGLLEEAPEEEAEDSDKE